METILDHAEEVAVFESPEQRSAPPLPGVMRVSGEPVALLHVLTILAASFNRTDALNQLLTHLSPKQINAPYDEKLDAAIQKTIAPLRAQHALQMTKSPEELKATTVAATVATNVTNAEALDACCQGDTALHLAVRLGSDHAAAALLAAGADCGAVNARGETPVDLATAGSTANQLVSKLLCVAQTLPNIRHGRLEEFANAWTRAGNRNERVNIPILIGVEPERRDTKCRKAR